MDLGYRKTREIHPYRDISSWAFNFIDIDGQIAVVKLTILEEDRKKYVDYLTPYKFEDGWKVITEQFSMF